MKNRILLAVLLLAAAGFTAQAMPSSQGGAALKGEVLEVQTVQTYTYLRLKTRDGEIWAAVPAATVKKGEPVTLTDTSMMENFESKALKRKFDRIVFGTLEGAKAASAAAAANPHGGGAPAKPVVVGKVAKATGADARTVAEVLGGPAALKGKTVTVRGQVVKVTSGILGKNWVHLQDGSGSADKRTNDLIVTTKDEIGVGDVVTASGTVRTDVNIGSGYAYAVLVEDARLRK